MSTAALFDGKIYVMRLIPTSLLAAATMMAIAPAAQADPIDDLQPSGPGIPLCLGASQEAGVGALGNWNANAGHVALQQVAQLSPSQHDVYNIVSGGNVITPGDHYCSQG
ncbi:hypothetical protein Lesp02_30300 [Lentzea sp. NBRC 105346]|uniref:hypothetical protein n=1 Tax=Lentzea sp. NBRC 105346 TaxID=3032205 RepID=UPI0024A4D4F5|nr:hypothetical protein [Lentzea sp. NBRC 105346]GLZ30841.1 hypothetical protein Lesp02_30300 [Lentzea sp. NBRC 105346]